MTRSVGLLVLLLGAPGLFGAGPPAPNLAPLVARLGGPDYEQREQAVRALEARGAGALPALRAAVHSPEPEVRRRASALLRRIESRLDTARVLAPTRLRLSYKDTPLTEAVADFARRAGVAVELAGDKEKWAGRRVTLDTGETTFWDALARFSAAAGLREQAPEGGFPTPKGRPGGIAYLDENAVARLRKLDGPLVLEDGKSPSLPTCVAGSLRVRALPPAGEQIVTLELSPEPRLAWQSVTFLRVDRAVDDRGRVLSPPAPYPGMPDPVAERERRIVVLSRVQLPDNSGVRRVSLRLPAGKNSSRRLRELRGTVGAWVGAPPEDLARVKDILKAEGRTTKARDGAALKVAEVRREGNRYHLVVERTRPRPPSDLIPGSARVTRMVLEWERRAAVPPRYAPFTLLDDRGRALPLVGGEVEVRDNETTKRFFLVYGCGKGGGRPAALVYTARRSVFVEVPFVLRDVPLAGR